MKKVLLTIVIFLSLLYSCKPEKKTETPKVDKEPTILEKIANANGYRQWGEVQELQFTFNVDRDTSHFERKWIWKPMTNEVTGISLGNTVTYNRKEVDSTTAKVDAAFINDKYWLLAPLNILWDKNSLTDSLTSIVRAPLSKNPMQKLTVIYGSEGGYTPGDAYDFYFTDDYIITEWVFRKENQAEPSLATTWEDYTEYGGLKISKMHNNEDGSFKLYFTEVEVITE